jgi:hypothetical protein
MSKLKIIFWILVVLFTAVFSYRALFASGDRRGKMLDPAKKNVQALLDKTEEWLPKEVLVRLDTLTVPILEDSYKEIKRRNLFARRQVSQKSAATSKTDKKGEETAKSKKKEEPPDVFFYKGTVQLGAKQVVILQEEGGRSFFVGKGDHLVLKGGESEYEVIDITTDEVVLLNSKSPQGWRVSVSKIKSK